MNTHAPSPFAGEGLYDWLRSRDPRWSKLAIVHRLDKETSGLILFGNSPLANRALTTQFTQRNVHKKYVFLTLLRPARKQWVIQSRIQRSGNRYVSGASGEPAETHFQVLHPEFTLPDPNGTPQTARLIAAIPKTGRTHQVRVHAAQSGVPILGDTLYGGAPFARACLHAETIEFQHPATGQKMSLRAPADFLADTRLTLRAALIDPAETSAFRLVHGAADNQPGWYVDRLGDFLLSQSESGLSVEREHALLGYAQALSSRGVYHKNLRRQLQRATVANTCPNPVSGELAPGRFVIRENGLQFELSFNEGYSVGLFLDQRDNRRRLLTGYVTRDFNLLDNSPATRNPQLVPIDSPRVLNTFAYTCGFSVCAARAGTRTTSLDLSAKYLEWGKRNLVLNGIDPAKHEFLHGDAFDWMRRLARKNRAFDLVLLDPPTFSQSRRHGAFQVEKEYPDLIRVALTLLPAGGTLFVATNAANWPPDKFLAMVQNVIASEKRAVLQMHYAPQPPDFPVARTEPAYLKTAWLRIGPGRPANPIPCPASA